MAQELLQSIDKLIEATSFIDEEKVVHNCESPYAYFPISGHKLGLNLDRTLVGKTKGFILEEGISLGSFINYAIKKALEEIERTQNRTIPVLDPKLRIAYGKRVSAESRLANTIKRFRAQLKKLRADEAVGGEENEK